MSAINSPIKSLHKKGSIDVFVWNMNIPLFSTDWKFSRFERSCDMDLILAQPAYQHNTNGAESMLQSHAVPVVSLYINNTPGTDSWQCQTNIGGHTRKRHASLAVSSTISSRAMTVAFSLAHSPERCICYRCKDHSTIPARQHHGWTIWQTCSRLYSSNKYIIS